MLDYQIQGSAFTNTCKCEAISFIYDSSLLTLFVQIGILDSHRGDRSDWVYLTYKAHFELVIVNALIAASVFITVCMTLDRSAIILTSL